MTDVTMVSVEHVSVLVFGAIMLAGAWLDLSRRQLPNKLCLLVFVAGSIATFLNYDAYDLLMAMVHAVLALVVGMVLFRFGLIGGGDAKFYAAAAVWFPLNFALKLLLNVSVAGLLLLVIWFVLRTLQYKSAEEKGKLDASGVPYGVAIGLGALLLATNTF